MAEETSPPTTTVVASPMAEETTGPPEASASASTPAPNGGAVDATLKEEEAEAKDSELEPSEDAKEHKRKLSDLEGGEEEHEEKKKDEADGEIEARISNTDEEFADSKRQRVDGDVVDGSGVDGGQDVGKVEAFPVGNGQTPLSDIDNTQSGSVENAQNISESLPQQGIPPSAGQENTSRKIEVPNNKVGVLIGKKGETIRVLQSNSGARIQITRDAVADSNSATRPVELTGTLENINKAEQLIKDVIAEADAGGSPALVARGFSAGQSGAEEYEMQVPNEKVGLIIGKNGDTIKNLQTKSYARIQLIPQHLPEGSSQKERTVRITGNKKQIEVAKDMIKDVMNQTPGRPSALSSGYNQNYRPRGPSNMLPPWGSRPPAQSHAQQNTGYDYPQRGGAYPPQSTQYPQQSYGSSSYPQQPPSRNTGWEQRPAGPVQTGGYDYYGGQGQLMGSNLTPAPTSASLNYNNYGQPPSAGYGQPNSSYAQSVPQQSYGYNEPKYDNQAPSYGQQQPVSSQPGFYPQGSTTPQTGYSQQPAPYTKPAAYTGQPQSYGQPNQAPVPSSYGSGGPTQQPSYPSYGSSVPSAQPAYGQIYGPPSGVSDGGYNQPPPSAGYAQPSNQVPPSYGQGAQSGGYGTQYASAQPATYGEQPAATNVNYGYQGATTDAGYGSSVPTSGYGAAVPVGGQPGYGQAGVYVQPSAANTASYDQSMALQSGYGSAPVGYAKGVSPQPGGYGGQQYDSVQMYGHH